MEEHSYCKREGIWTENPQITATEVKKALDELKSNKAAGPDRIKGEMYKILKNDGNFIEKLTESLNKIMEGEIPETWKYSRMTLLPKKKRRGLKPKEFRPITVTNISYKIFTDIINRKISKFLKKNKIMEEEQAGFTTGRRMEEHLVALQLEIGKARRMKRKKWVAAIDIEKAFDTVEREEIIKTLNEIGMEKTLINVIAKLYKEDKCIITREGQEVGEVKKTRGIKQGCKMSPTLFNIMLNNTIRRVNKMFGKGCDHFNCLYYADDGLIMADSEHELQQKINIVKHEYQKIGLKINMEKSEVIVFGKEEKEQIAGMRRVGSIKYLGVKIEDTKNIFKAYIKEKIKKQKSINIG